MKRNEMAELLHRLNASPEQGTVKNVQETLLDYGITNFYQELEMDSPWVNAQRDISYESDTVQLHSHDFYEFIYCRSGNVQYLLGTSRYRLQHGDVVIVPPGISHRPVFLEQLAEPYERYALWISRSFFALPTELMPTMPSMDIAPGLRLLRTGENGRGPIESLFYKLEAEDRERAPFYEMRMLSLCMELVVQMLRQSKTETHAAPEPEQKTMLDDVMEYIEQNLTGHISLESTARQFLVSESTVSKLFHGKMDVSFYRFVTQRRLIAAKTLIGAGQNLQEIPEQTGFSDYSTFFRAFKKEYGISPVQYKKLTKGEKR